MNTDKFTWNAKLIYKNAQLKPFTLKAVPPEKSNLKLKDALKEISRLSFGRPKDIVSREIILRAGIGQGKKNIAEAAPLANAKVPSSSDSRRNSAFFSWGVVSPSETAAMARTSRAA